LRDLCAFSWNTTSQNQIDVDNYELVTTYLFPEGKVQSEVNDIVDLFRNSTSIRVMSILDYFKMTTHVNYLVSALNTNVLITVWTVLDEYVLQSIELLYSPDSTSIHRNNTYLGCGTANPLSPTGFFSTVEDTFYLVHTDWYKPELNSTLVAGFFAGCIPLEALLSSTLDCLYDIQCLQLLTDYFPVLDQVCVAGSSLFLSSIILV
jgi:hypothetical protein